MTICTFSEYGIAPIVLDPAIAYLGNEAEGLSVDFMAMRAYTRDKTTPANNFLGNPNVQLTYTSPSPKWLFDITGKLVLGTGLRCDYDPVTHAPLGILVEPQATNLTLQSQAFDNMTAWFRAQVAVTPDAAIAPDGTMTADKLIENVSAANVHEIRQTPAITSGAVVCLSVYAKAAERGCIEICIINANYVTTRFDLINGIVFSSADSVGSVFSNRAASIVPCGNGWFRCILLAQTTGITSVATHFRPCLDVNTNSYVGDGVSGIYIWGAQCEAVVPGTPFAIASATSYVPTTTATVTRNSDNIRLVNTAFPWKLAQGTWVIDIADAKLSGSSRLIGSVGPPAPFYITGPNIIGTYNGATTLIRNVSYSLMTGSRVAMAYDASGRSVTGMGIVPATDAVLELAPGTNTFSFGSQAGTSLFTAPHIKRMKYLPRRASDTELRAMTAFDQTTPADAYLGAEPIGMAIDFTANSAVVRGSDTANFSGTPQDMLSVIRASNATYYDAAGVIRPVGANILRLDYDPVTHAPLGLLVEEARTNIVIQSQALDDASWSKGFTTVAANAAVAPDGTLTADTLIEDTTAASGHRLYKTTVTIAAGTQISVSFYVKRASGTRNVYALFQNSANAVYCRINLSDGSVIQAAKSGDAVFTSCTVDVLANGWYRVKLIATTSASTANPAFQIYLNNTATADGFNTPVYDGDGTSGIHLWGVQIEAPVNAANPFVTSYIPTTTATVLRADDNISLGPGLFAYSPTAGTWIAEINALATTINNNCGLEIAVDTQNYVSLRHFSALITAANVTQFNSIPAGWGVSTTVSKRGLVWTTNDAISCLNGVLGAADNAVTLPTGSFTLRFRVANAPTLNFNGHVRKLKYLPRRVSNAELQAMTT